MLIYLNKIYEILPLHMGYQLTVVQIKKKMYRKLSLWDNRCTCVFVTYQQIITAIYYKVQNQIFTRWHYYMTYLQYIYFLISGFCAISFIVQN